MKRENSGSGEEERVDMVEVVGMFGSKDTGRKKVMQIVKMTSSLSWIFYASAVFSLKIGALRRKRK